MSAKYDCSERKIAEMYIEEVNSKTKFISQLQEILGNSQRLRSGFNYKIFQPIESRQEMPRNGPCKRIQWSFIDPLNFRKV